MFQNALKKGRERVEMRKGQLQDLKSRLSKDTTNLSDEEFECVERIDDDSPVPVSKPTKSSTATRLRTPTVDDSPPGTPEVVDMDDQKVPISKDSSSSDKPMGHSKRPIMRLHEKLKDARDRHNSNFKRGKLVDDTNDNNTESQSHLNEDGDSNFNYLTDICREKKFDKKELDIILKVLRLELQPLTFLFYFIKGLLLWTNSALSVGVLMVLLYLSYLNVTEWIFGMVFMMCSGTMLCMKLDAETTSFMLCCLVGMVTPIDDDESSSSIQSNDDKEDEEEDRFIGWRARRMRMRIKKLRSNFGKVGEAQYVLYQLTILIGKVRTILFYKNEEIGKFVCFGLAVFGAVCIVLPFRVLYSMTVLMAFGSKPLSEIVKKRKQLMKQKGIDTGDVAEKMKAMLDTVEPDIPKIELIKEE